MRDIGHRKRQKQTSDSGLKLAYVRVRVVFEVRFLVKELPVKLVLL